MAVSTYSNSRSAIRVYRVLKEHGQISGVDLDRLAFIARRSRDGMMKVFKDCGLVHIAGWERTDKSKYRYSVIYGFGPGEDAPRNKSGVLNPSCLPSVLAHKAIDLMSKGGTWTVEEVAKALNSSIGHASKTLRKLSRGKDKLCFVDKWLPSKGAYIPAYRAGTERNVPRPGGKDAATKNRERRRHLKEEFGPEIARRINATRAEGGAETIVIDGRVRYKRREPRQRRAA